LCFATANAVARFAAMAARLDASLRLAKLAL